VFGEFLHDRGALQLGNPGDGLPLGFDPQLLLIGRRPVIGTRLISDDLALRALMSLSSG
jgi:hypothetical protein